MRDKSRGQGDVETPLREPQVFERLFAAYASTAGIAILDSEKRYLWVNDRLAALNGRRASEHFGKTVREILGDFASQVEPHMERAFSTGLPVSNVELSGFHAGTDSTVHRRQHFFPIKTESGRVEQIGIVVTDMTEEKELHTSIRDLSGKLRKEMTRLQILADINTLLSSNWDVPMVFRRVSAHIRRVLGQELAGLLIYDAEHHELVPQAVDFPLSKGLIAPSPVKAKHSPAEYALQSGESVIYSKKELEGFEAEIARSLIAEGLKSLCCVPMMRPRGPLGVLILGSTRHDAFTKDDLGLLTQVANQLALAIENHLAASEIKVLKQRLGEERSYLEGEIEHQGHFTEIAGKSLALQEVLHQVTTVAKSDATVLILGETGTGKELIARAVHRVSHRKDGPFVKVNCAAIPTGLLESELFGHEKGAFTGAISQKIGRMELAHEGTLFLDEIGEISLEVQPKLLRVLQDQEFERLGSNRTIRVSLRLIAATNRDLAASIAQNQFRSDLYYRLSVFPIVMPPLRQRKEDIPSLVRYFVRQFSLRMNRHVESVTHNTMDALLEWDWPGNVRELENLMERSVILSEGTVLRVPLSELRPQTRPQVTDAHVPDQNLGHAERQHIIRVLRETHGRLSGPDGAAKRLGLKRTTLQSKMQRLNITRDDYTPRKDG